MGESQSDNLAVNSLLFTADEVKGKKKITKQRHKPVLRALDVLVEITVFSAEACRYERPVALGGDTGGT